MQKVYVNSDEIQIILNNQEVINVHTSVINKLYFDVVSVSYDWCKDTKEFRVISNIQNLIIELDMKNVHFYRHLHNYDDVKSTIYDDCLSSVEHLKDCLNIRSIKIDNVQYDVPWSEVIDSKYDAKRNIYIKENVNALQRSDYNNSTHILKIEIN